MSTGSFVLKVGESNSTNADVCLATTQCSFSTLQFSPHSESFVSFNSLAHRESSVTASMDQQDVDCSSMLSFLRNLVSNSWVFAHHFRCATFISSDRADAVRVRSYLEAPGGPNCVQTRECFKTSEGSLIELCLRSNGNFQKNRR